MALQNDSLSILWYMAPRRIVYLVNTENKVFKSFNSIANLCKVGKED